MIRLFLLSFAFISLFPISAVAKDEAKKLAEENQKKVEEEIEKDTPITEWVSSENALLKRLPAQNKKTFFILRNKHSVIRAVETVKRDVGSAIKACSKNNKDMKTSMNTRFKEWTGSVDPILKDAKKFLEVELEEQEAFHLTDYRHIMKLNDKAYKFSESQIKKTPVTTPEACQSLLKSMDETEEKLIDLLQTILLPEEVIRERTEQAKKAEKKSKEN